VAKIQSISRREFLKLSTIASSAFLLSGCGFLDDGNPASTAANLIRFQPLPIPKLLTGTEIDGKKVYDLTIQQGSMA